MKNILLEIWKQTRLKQKNELQTDTISAKSHLN